MGLETLMCYVLQPNVIGWNKTYITTS